MKRTLDRIVPVLALVLALALGGCAAGQGQAGGTEIGADQVTVQINNDLVPPSGVTLYMVPETGSRRRLGPVNPGGSATFGYTPGIRSADYRLVAEVVGGSSVTSNPFSLTGVSTVAWDLSNRTVRLSEE